MASESSTSARDAYDAAEAVKSTLVSLADLCAKGTSHYARRQYGEAADYYARASELQAGLKGEMDPENAEVLFLYGRSLFRVGQGKSDVLGGRAQGGRERKKAEGVVGERVEGVVVTEGVEERVEGVVVTEGVKEEGEEGKEVKKPLFQFTGDENFEESEDEEEGEGEEEEEEDELATAFEVLDLARVLFTRKLESPESGDADGNGKGKEVGDSATTKHIKERLADTHDLLAEISLENERFPSAVADFRASLGYKKELYGQESEVIAEAHYKLSLALEFASITTTAEAGEGEGEGEGKGEAQVDEGMREEAARELESAIESTRMKLQAKEVELAEMASPEENDETRKQIAEVREILADMEQRLVDLRAPPVDINAALNVPTSAAGVIAATLGESPAEAARRIEEATRGATDLTSMVRKKEKKSEPAAAGVGAGAAGGTNGDANGKRKAEDDGEAEGKKAKVEEK